MRLIHAVRALAAETGQPIETIALHTDVDRTATFVREADIAYDLGPAAARPYLDLKALERALVETEADAAWVGWGFVAEDPAFAELCDKIDVTFVGPSAEAMRKLGDKIGAKLIAETIGVPVAPWSRGGLEDLDAAVRAAKEIGYPLMLKATAGGGGRGVRVINSEAELVDAYERTSQEAERAFGSGVVFLEQLVTEARHVEVQLIADGKTAWALGVRDCSVQRRHQKIIEESPSPAVSPELRKRMTDAALALARGIGYTNAGTVEFLLAPSGEFYFIEVNTRIQVEHPVTEMVTGLDLIRLQIEIAQGARLPAEAAAQRGHAIEARLYAEDPANGFLPSTGTLHVWEAPATTIGVRVDSGVEEGSEIGVHYDPLLAKVIAPGADREAARHKLAYALRHFAAQGVQTNREYLIDVLEHSDFQSGRAHTGWKLQAPPAGEEAMDRVFAAIAHGWAERTEHAQRKILPTVPLRFRNNPYPAPVVRFAIAGREVHLRAGAPTPEILTVDGESMEAVVDGIRHHFFVRRAGDTYYVRSDLGQRAVVRQPRYPRAASAGRQAANSPMPGQVLRVVISPGQRVTPGDPLVVLEAMKMEQTIRATMNGVVGAILVKPGEIVAPGQMLVEIRSVEESDEHAGSSAAKQ